MIIVPTDCTCRSILCDLAITMKSTNREVFASNNICVFNRSLYERRSQMRILRVA